MDRLHAPLDDAECEWRVGLGHFEEHLVVELGQQACGYALLLQICAAPQHIKLVQPCDGCGELSLFSLDKAGDTPICRKCGKPHAGGSCITFENFQRATDAGSVFMKRLAEMR